jgi:DNA-binding transcriptional LysR family regulator
MKRYTYLKTFVEVARTGRFITAAQAMGLPRSTVSQHVQKLEADLGVRLIRRNTRDVSLTEAGRRLFQNAEANLEGLDRAFRQLQGDDADFTGTIRVSAPADFDPAPIAKAISEVSKAYPGADFELRLTNEVVSLIKEDIDVAIGIATRNDGGRVERQVLPVSWCLCTSAGYLDANGVDRSLDELQDFIAPPRPLRTLLEREVFGGRSLPDGRFTCDHLAMAKALVVGGLGVGLVPRGMVSSELGRGELRTLLDDEITGTTPLSVVFASRQDIQPPVRAFYQAFRAAMTVS